MTMYAYEGGPLDGQAIDLAGVPAEYRDDHGQRQSKSWGHARLNRGVYRVGPSDGYRFDSGSGRYVYVGLILERRRQEAIANRREHVRQHPEDTAAYGREIGQIEAVGRQYEQRHGGAL